MEKSGLRKVIQYVVMLALAALLLYYSFKGVEWRSFVESLQKCRWGWIALSMLVGILGFLFRALRLTGPWVPLGAGGIRLPPFWSEIRKPRDR